MGMSCMIESRRVGYVVVVVVVVMVVACREES